MKTRMLIGLTGGIGSGKSTALNALKKVGYSAISCDEITRELYRRRKILKTLKKEFPSAITGRFKLAADKKEISRIVFSDEKKYAFLTDFLAKEAFRIALKRAKKLTGKVIIEVPLLFESGVEKSFDKIIVITRGRGARIESVKSRSGLTEKEVLERINKQTDYDKKDLSAYAVIKNDGSDKDLAAAAIRTVDSF